MADDRGIEERRAELAAYRRSIGWSEELLADEERRWQLHKIDPPFASWLDDVYTIVTSVAFAMETPRIADEAFRAWYEQGVMPLQAARKALDNSDVWTTLVSRSKEERSLRYRFWKRTTAGRHQTEATPLEQRELFWRWMELLNEHIRVAGGRGAEFYRSCDYWDWFNSGVPAHDAAERAMQRR